MTESASRASRAAVEVGTDGIAREESELEIEQKERTQVRPSLRKMIQDVCESRVVLLYKRTANVSNTSSLLLTQRIARCTRTSNF
jgi:hypothetical protein